MHQNVQTDQSGHLDDDDKDDDDDDDNDYAFFLLLFAKHVCMFCAFPFDILLVIATVC